MAYDVLDPPRRRVEATGPPDGSPHRGKRRLGLRVLTLLLLCAVAVTTFSYMGALTYPGHATWQQRTVSWIRDHGGSPIVNRAENWYYTRRPPSTSAPNPASLPAAPQAGVPAAVGPHVLPARSGVAGEGAWVPGRTGANGQPASYTSFFQPDPAHASVVAGVAWIRAGATTAHLVAGTTQPGGHRWSGHARVPATAVPKLVAVFNSGFKLNDIIGGYYIHGRAAKPLRNGQASLVISDRGVITVGQWGRDMTMNPHITSVRQNLALIVDAGHPANGLTVNADQRWGSAANQLQYTWRSGIGTDAAGNVIYVAGDKLTLATLATALADAGAVTGMQLDIHPGMAFYSAWTTSQSLALRRTSCSPLCRALRIATSPPINATSSTSPSTETG